MPKVGMEPIRRRQLIDATIASMHEDGFANTTVQRISRRAGLSSGIIAHYFQDKAGLMEATMRMLVEHLRQEGLERLSRARTPHERIDAIIDANFAPTQCVPEVVSAWLAFWSMVRQAPGLLRIQRVYQRRLRSNLLYAFKLYLPRPEAERLTAGLAALIDGLWLNAALAGGEMDAEAARRIAKEYVQSQILGPQAQGNPS